jgi:microcystin-dependent protein
MPGGIPIPPIPILAPIGSVVAWLKSFTNTPALPSGWVECNGQTLSDADSVYNGQTIPNLNGNNYFLRGDSTSGSTGGASTVTLSIANLPAHSHTIASAPPGSGGGNAASTNSTATGYFTSSSVGSGTAHENKPPYYTVVWIMRVK